MFTDDGSPRERSLRQSCDTPPGRSIKLCPAWMVICLPAKAESTECWCSKAGGGRRLVAPPPSTYYFAIHDQAGGTDPTGLMATLICFCEGCWLSALYRM